jgi:5-(carboxyamino)imidazole ribonucleotide mutase
LPVIGVPVALARLDGMDSLLSIVQMPRGVPVATVAINGATNAGLLAARILATSDAALSSALEEYRDELAQQANQQDHELPRS